MINLVVDGNSIYARSWFAAERDSGTPDPAKAILFTLTTVFNLLNPDANLLGHLFDRTLFAWDSQQNKSKHRAEKPVSYHDTKELLIDMLTALLGSSHYWHDDYEGDDVVATAVFASDPNDTVYVVSGDKDLMMLQGGNCEYYCLNTKAVLSRGFIQNKFNVKRPSQVSLALAILGDKVDNIPGIKGWGPKKVRKLFELVTPKMNFEQALQTIDAQVPQVFRQVFYESLERVLLKTDVPGVPPPAPLVLADPELVNDWDMPQVALRYQVLFSAYATARLNGEVRVLSRQQNC